MPFKFNFRTMVPQVLLALLALLCLGISIADMATGGAGDPGTQIQSGFNDGFMFLLGFMVLLGALLIPYYRRDEP